MKKKSATEVMEIVREALMKNNLGRYSTFRGGENHGWNMHYANGYDFSIRPAGDYLTETGWKKIKADECAIHFELSGKKAGLRYREYKEYSENRGIMNMHEPIDSKSLYPKIAKVFTDLGFKVINVSTTGHQTHWDDDVGYEVVVKRPVFLEKPPSQ